MEINTLDAQKSTVTQIWYCASVSLRSFCNPATRAFPVKRARYQLNALLGSAWYKILVTDISSILDDKFSARIKLRDAR